MATATGSQSVQRRARLVFLSLRFGEGMWVGELVKKALEAKGIHAFLCDVQEGGDIAQAISDHLDRCDLVVVLGTKTYGRKTSSGFSTFQELRFVMDYEKPFFLIKMCESFAESETRLRLPPSIAYFPWTNYNADVPTALPADLVTHILKKLDSVFVAIIL